MSGGERASDDPCCQALEDEKMPMPTLVISAVNIVEGGMLKILHDCLDATRRDLPDWRIVALVNNAKFVTTPGIEVIALPQAKKSWLRRVYTEYAVFKKISRDLKADIWWSLHDLSPFVEAKSQFVYCHNPLPFYRLSMREIGLEPGLVVFNALYSLFYRINIHSNRAVIVQQQWMREEFEQRYDVRNVIVAHPVGNETALNAMPTTQMQQMNTFVYPSLSRAFKNFELIGDAARLLADEPDWNGRILLTISPDETRLAKDLFRRYGAIRGIEFIGRQTRQQMDTLYGQMDCLLFPSRLETWGLPITEAKALGKPMILADLPYAHETVGSYRHVSFVDPASARQLADVMLNAHRTGWRSKPVLAAPIAEPFVKSWTELVATVVRIHAGGQPPEVGISPTISSVQGAV